ncbi:MAG: GIY-YIG nuclease family protein [Deltaproteobacteria bacterium]|nr:GIY-YIG nuclease family protein [Deltaproteobacteria bacterium]
MQSPDLQDRAFFMTMSHWVYIIQSETTGRYYCGQSSDTERRLRQHNDPEYQLSQTTKRFQGPWKLVHTMACANRSEATILERKIKKRGISRYLRDSSVGGVPSR